MDFRKAVFALALIASFGCGGGGGGNNGGGSGFAANSPQVTISWPTRTRSISAPNSALSFELNLTSTGPKYTIVGDRPSSLSPVSATYHDNVTATAGTYQLACNFYAEPGETGPVVGTVSATVSVQSNGTLLTTTGQPLDLVFAGVIKSVAVDPSQTVTVGQTTALAATAYDASGNPIVITAGSFSFALSGSSSILTLATNGNAKGIANGTALVTVSVDGFTSPPELVTVGPSSTTFNSFSLTAASVAYDASRNVIYAACTPQSSYYAGLVSVIQLGSNQFGPTLPVTNGPFQMAVSGDDKYLYVGGTNGTVQQVNLTTDKVEATIPLPAGTVPNQMLTLPGATESVAITLTSSSDYTADEGTVILDGTTFRAQPVKIGLSIDTNSSGSRIYGYQLYKTSGSLYSSANIGSAGITGVQSQVSPTQGSANRIHWSQNRIIFDSGAVLDPDAGTVVGQFPLPAASTLAVPIVGTDVVYFLSGTPYEVNRYSLSSLRKNDTIQFTGPTGYPQRAIALGAGRIGFHTIDGSPNAVYALSGLP